MFLKPSVWCATACVCSIKVQGGVIMILADKIIMLRKKAGWSQEDLAGELNVSRQSISKWEGALSIPDMDKIIKLSQVFGVSTDFLLIDEKEDLSLQEITASDDLRKVSIEEAGHYLDMIQLTSRKIAAAVSMFIASPIILIAGEFFIGNQTLSQTLSHAVGLTVLLSLVAIGVLLIISTLADSAPYKYLDHQAIELMYGVEGIIKKQQQVFQRRGYTEIGIGVVLCILSVIPLLILSDISERLEIFGVVILLTMVAIAVNRFIVVGMTFSAFSKLLQEEEYTIKAKLSNKIIDRIAGPYWLTCTAIYLFLSFTQNAWGQTWIVWPIAGILFAIIAAIVDSVYNDIK